MRRGLGLLGWVVVAGLAGGGCQRSATAPLDASVAVPVTSSPVDAGPSDEEVFAASLARLAQFKREAEEAEAAARRPPDAGPASELARGSPDGGASPELYPITALAQLDDAVERVHAMFRQGSKDAYARLLLVCAAVGHRADSGDTAAAERAFKRLLELPTGDPRVRVALSELASSLAMSSVKAAQYERAKQQARAALELEDTNSRAYLVLGELEFQQNDLNGAMSTWEHGLRINPADTALVRRVESARVEMGRVGALERLSSEHFVVSFDGRADVPAARATLEAMEVAYRQVGALFQQFPEGPLPLVLYPHGSFADQGHASWTAGFYDGKIRLPAEGASSLTLALKGTLFHEYAHALFHRSTRGAKGPAWLNEGFAEIARLRGDPGPALLCQRSVHSFPLKSLHAGFGRLDRGNAFYAYLEARHVLEHLIERHGEEGVRNLFAAMATEPDFPRAFERALGQSYDSFSRAFDTELR